MKLREQTNKQICDENDLPFTIITNVVEERSAKNRMRATSNLIAKALIATLGPYGSSTIIQDRMGRHFATKDGYDLMNRMTFDDEVSRTILDLLRTTASNQVLSVGDGSTSAIVVANALFQALTNPERREEFDKIAPKDIIDILNDLSEKLEYGLRQMAKPVSPDMHELDIIAAIANNNDYAAGKTIADIYRKIGQNGFITMDFFDKKDKDDYELKTGIEWERGWVDPVFEKFADQDGKVIYSEKPKVFITNSCLSYDDLEMTLMPVIKEALNQEGSELLIVANDFDPDVIQFLKNNRTKHMQYNSRAPEMIFTAVDIDQVTKEGRNTLEDLAMLCGCKIFDKVMTKQGDAFAHPADYIGRADRILITKKTTQVIACKDMTDDHRKKIDSFVKDLNAKIEKLQKIEEPTKEEDEALYEARRRVSRLTSASAMLHVGGKTLAERMTRQRLIEDAVLACKSALKYGYIPGGNLCIPKYLFANREGLADFLGTKYSYLPIDKPRGFFLYFIDMLTNTFLESYRAVLNNSYFNEDETEEVIEKCFDEGKFYNLKKHEYENWEETEVINSVDTDIQILRTCISIIGILSQSNQMMTMNFDANSQIYKDK